MKFRIYIVLIILALGSSCGEYEKLLKSSDYDLKKERAKEYYNAGLFVKATELFAQILPRYRATEEAEELNFMNARSFYGMKDYIMAGSYFKTFVEQYPFGKYAEEANFLAAMCDYHLSPKPELDQGNTVSALEGFNIFINRFPQSPRVEESRRMITELQEKLVQKSYISAKLYYDMRQYKAAAVALNNSLKEHADTKYREEMMFLKLNSLFLYAENSQPHRQKERYQDALDDYYSFMEEYPSSKYAKDVQQIYQETISYLKIGAGETASNNQ
jgi:outer membrane protein assembly factor BamD